MNIIASADKNWGIGKKNDLLDSFKEDMKFFREKTMGNAVIMGRATLESLPGGKPLPNRENIVLTRNENFKAEGVKVFSNLSGAVEYAKSKYKSQDIYFMGGEEIYRQAVKICDTAFITKFDRDYRAEKFIMNFDEAKDWQISEIKEVETEKDGESRRLVFAKYVRTENSAD